MYQQYLNYIFNKMNSGVEFDTNDYEIYYKMSEYIYNNFNDNDVYIFLTKVLNLYLKEFLNDNDLSKAFESSNFKYKFKEEVARIMPYFNKRTSNMMEHLYFLFPYIKGSQMVITTDGKIDVLSFYETCKSLYEMYVGLYPDVLHKMPEDIIKHIDFYKDFYLKNPEIMAGLKNDMGDYLTVDYEAALSYNSILEKMKHLNRFGEYYFNYIMQEKGYNLTHVSKEIGSGFGYDQRYSYQIGDISFEQLYNTKATDVSFNNPEKDVLTLSEYEYKLMQLTNLDEYAFYYIARFHQKGLTTNTLVQITPHMLADENVDVRYYLDEYDEANKQLVYKRINNMEKEILLPEYLTNPVKNK